MGIKIKDIVEGLKNKSTKKGKIFIIVVLICFVFVIAFSEIFSQDGKKKTENENSFNSQLYVENLENRLEKIISSIDGAGECKVMVTLDTGEENIYAKESKNQNEDRNELSKTSDEYEYVILKSSSSKEDGMLLKVVEPNIRGVAIVCRGGDNYTVKENIISAVKSVLDIKTNQISITKMKAN